MKHIWTKVYSQKKHKTGKGCLYINKLSEVDIKVLKEIIKISANKKM
jgi:hypothetical protein